MIVVGCVAVMFGEGGVSVKSLLSSLLLLLDTAASASSQVGEIGWFGLFVIVDGIGGSSHRAFTDSHRVEMSF